ncbi:MAG: glycosyltransferase family 2 protein [Myxococcales bacterium]|nr:glycosyltransferase family 2 protein [Myxococcales bacterium]
MSTRPALSVVVPAYNEEARLGPPLERIRAYLGGRADLAGAWELIVVDDGSRDGTVAIAEAAAAAEPRVRVVVQPANRGKGAAVRAGALAAAGARVLFSDADLATPIEEVEKLEARLAAGADVAIASRALPDSDIRVRQHPLRETMGRTFNVLVRALMRGAIGPIKDTQCGFKLFTAAAARDLFGRATVDGFAFDVELLYLARGRWRVDEVPVVWRHVDESKVSPGTDAARMLLDVVRLRWRHR